MIVDEYMHGGYVVYSRFDRLQARSRISPCGFAAFRRYPARSPQRSSSSTGANRPHRKGVGHHFLPTSFFSAPNPPDEPFPPWLLAFEEDDNAPKAAYMLWLSRGDCPNVENAWGEAGPVGKKPDMGDEGEEL
jgi:hypothetical protein